MATAPTSNLRMTSDSDDAEGTARSRHVTQVLERLRAPLARYLKSLLARRENAEDIQTMNSRRRLIAMHTRHFAPLLLVLASLTALAQERPPQQPQPAAAPAAPATPAPPAAQAQPSLFPGLPTVALEPLLQRVGRAANKKFLVDGRVNPQIYLGGVDANEVTYPLLLSILRANSLGVVEIEGRVNVIPAFEMRFYGPLIANSDDPNIPADEYRTRVVQLTNVEAAQIVPVVRPLLSVVAHLSAFPQSNQLIIADRYANLKRITEIVRTLDKPPPR
jgi:hypothetical protein